MSHLDKSPSVGLGSIMKCFHVCCLKLNSSVSIPTSNTGTLGEIKSSGNIDKYSVNCEDE